MLFVAVWPYRTALSVHEDCIRIRWFIFRSSISTTEIIQMKLEPTALGFHLLTLRRHGAPQLVFEASFSQLTALHTALLAKLNP
jgi:hypothetical protein